MTTITTDNDQLINRIHETAYWRVLLHPTAFEERRIPSLQKCESLIREVSVRLRGWDYPHVDSDPQAIIRGDDYIEAGCDFANHVELWRFYQSAQFVHQFAVKNDRMPINPYNQTQPEGTTIESNQLDWLDTLYTLVEITQFTRGLAYRSVLDPAAKLRIELHGMKGRWLCAPPGRSLLKDYTSRINTISWECTNLAADFVANAPQLAVDAAVHIFERFNWPIPPRALFEEEQRRFLERRT